MSMRVKDLITALKQYPPDKYVFFTMQGSPTMYFVDSVETTRSGNYPCIGSDEAPNFDDLEGIADACWNEHWTSMTEKERAAMREFSELACQAEKERKLEEAV